jgi:hypothetical protein
LKKGESETWASDVEGVGVCVGAGACFGVDACVGTGDGIVEDVFGGIFV